MSSTAEFPTFWAKLSEHFYDASLSHSPNQNGRHASATWLFGFFPFTSTTLDQLKDLLQNRFFSTIRLSPEFQHHGYSARYVMVSTEVTHSLKVYLTLDLFQHHLTQNGAINVFLPRPEMSLQLEPFLKQWFGETMSAPTQPPPRCNDQVTLVDIISPLSARYLVEDMCQNINYHSIVARIICEVIEKDIVYIDESTTYEYNYANRSFERTSGKGGSCKSICAYLVKIGEYILFDFVPFLKEKIELARKQQVDRSEIEKLELELKNTYRLAELLMGPGQCAIHAQIIIALNEKVKRNRMEIVHSFNTINDWLPFKNNVNVNVVTGEVKERTREDRITGTCAIDWCVNEENMTKARLYFWDLASHDLETEHDLKAVGNVSFQGVNKHKLFPVLAGGKNCGKSTFIKALKAILGPFAVICDTAIICVPPMGRTVTQHTGTLSMLEGKRLFILDDTLGPNSNLDLNTIKNMTTPGVSTPIRDAGPGQGREMLITGIPLSAFNIEATPKGFREEGAIKERTRVIECRTEHVDPYRWEKLTEEEKQSGLYQLKNLNIDEEMLRPEMLSALAAVIILDGGKIYRERVEQYGTPFPVTARQEELFSDLVDISTVKEWLDTVARPAVKTNININALVERWNLDFPREQKKSSEMKKELKELGLTVKRGLGISEWMGTTKRNLNSLINYEWTGQTFSGKPDEAPSMNHPFVRAGLFSMGASSSSGV